MTITKALDALDRAKPNVFTQAEKLGWLSEVEGTITEEIVRTHKGGETEEFVPFGDGTDMETELTAPPPYDRLYPLYLAAQVDRMNGETGKYNNSMTLFSAAYGDFRSWYNRTHEPAGEAVQYWRGGRHAISNLDGGQPEPGADRRLRRLQPQPAHCRE